MTDDKIPLRALLENSSDASMVREMIGLAAERLMPLETEVLCCTTMTGQFSVPATFTLQTITCLSAGGSLRPARGGAAAGRLRPLFAAIHTVIADAGH